MVEPPSSLTRRPSMRRDREESLRLAKIQASPSSRRKEFGLPTEEKSRVPASPGLARRKGSNSTPMETDGKAKSPAVGRRGEAPSPSATPNLRRKGSIRHTLESLRKAAAKEEELMSLSPTGSQQSLKPPSRNGSLRGQGIEAAPVGAAKEVEDNLKLTKQGKISKQGMIQLTKRNRLTYHCL